MNSAGSPPVTYFSSCIVTAAFESASVAQTTGSFGPFQS